MTGMPFVAIIGRPNVGKSTLFNRLIRRPLAITHDTPGVTRDRNAAEFEWNGRPFMLVDTGGFAVSSRDKMEQAVCEQSMLAIEEADVVLFLVDVKSGVTNLDQDIRNILIRSGKPVVLGVNKVDNINAEPEIYRFYNLGLGDPFPVSGHTGLGTGDILDALVANFPHEEDARPKEEAALRIAVIGRPNVGKSSLVNALTGKKTVIVSDAPGTTRDSVDAYLTYQGHKIALVDTAGMKPAARLKESLDYFSSIRSLRSLSRCDVAIVVLDIFEGMTSYDKSLIDDAVKVGKGIIIAANKWDLIEKDSLTSKRFEERIRQELPDKTEYPVIFISALSGQRVRKTLELAWRIGEARRFRAQTADFNRFIQSLHIPPAAGDIIIRYGVQHGIEPPSFVIFVNDPRKVKDSVLRYIEKCIRNEYRLEGTPVRLTCKK